MISKVKEFMKRTRENYVPPKGEPNIKAEFKRSNCPNSPGVMFNDATGKLVKAGCGSWNCPYCAPKKKYDLMQRANAGFGNTRTRMITLTERKSIATKDIADDIMHHWARVRASLAKYGYKHIRFWWIKEYSTNKSNPNDHNLYPHLHIAVDVSIPKKLLERLWLKATEGTAHIVDIGKISVKVAAAYMTKYMAKGFDGLGNDGFTKYERRFGFSRTGHFAPQKKENSEWKFVKKHSLGPYYDEVYAMDHVMQFKHTDAIKDIVFPGFSAKTFRAEIKDLTF